MTLLNILKTLITADNSDFKKKVNDSTIAAQKFSSTTTAAFKTLGRFVATAGIGTAFWKIYETGRDSLDELTASAERLGVSAENFQFLQYAAKQSDVEISKLEASMRRLNLSISRADGSKSLTEAFAEIDISARQLKQLNIDEAFFKIITALQKLPKDRRIDLGTQFFGKDFQSLAGLAAADIEKLYQNFEKLGGAINVAKFAELDKRLNDLSTRGSQLSQSLFLAFGPLIIKQIEYFVDAIDIANKALQSTFNLIGSKGPNSIFNTPIKAVNKFNNSITGLIDADSFTRPATSEDYAFTRLGKILENFSNRLLGFSGPRSAAGAGVDAAAFASESIMHLGKAAADAAKGMEVLRDLKSALGLGEVGGQEYLSTILKPQKQAMDPFFNEIAQDVQEMLAEGVNTAGVPFQSALATLRSRAAQFTPNAGESKSGMVNAAQFLTDLAKKIQPKDQKVVLELKYDQDGILKAFIGSSQFANVAGNVVMELAAKEAQSTIASGG